MSERMTNDEVRAFINAVNNMNAMGGNEAHVPRGVMTKIAQEISAGRVNEVRKDEIIKALADALAQIKYLVPRRSGLRPRVDAALRLAGRLP